MINTERTHNFQKYDRILAEIERDLDLIVPELREWNVNYFNQHKKRYKSDLQIISRYYRTGDILEVGALPCHLTCCLKRLAYPVIGLDLDPERMSAFIKKHDLNIIKCNIETQTIPFDSDTFDLIIFNEILEHLRIDPISTLREVNRVLKPGGIMILSTPNLCSLDKIRLFITGHGFDDPYRQ